MFPQSFTKNTALPYYKYDQRGLLREWSPQDGAQALVDSLGMFVYTSNSSQSNIDNVNANQVYDDDESCFVTGDGAWLLEYPHWDVVNAWMLPDIENIYSKLSSTGGSSGTLANTLTSVTAGACAIAGTVNIENAKIGDTIAVSTSRPILGTGANTGNYIPSGIVTSPGRVTVYLSNPDTASSPNIPAGLSYYVSIV